MKGLNKSIPRCDHCGSTCGLIQFDGNYVCGDYLIRKLKITRKALDLACEDATDVSSFDAEDYFEEAKNELYPETEQTK
jgi:hypothetical protein